MQPHSVRDVVQRFYETEAAYMTCDVSDFAPVAATLTDDILLHEPASLPYGGEFRGRDDFERWLRAFAHTWSSMEVRDSEMFVDGNHATSRSPVCTVLRQTDEKMDWLLLQLFRVRDGQVAELRPFHWDTAALMQAIAKLSARGEQE